MMEKLGTEQRTKVVQFCFESQHSIIQTQRSCRNFFHIRNAPSVPTIYRFVHRFQQQGAVFVIFCVLEDLAKFEMM